MIARSPLAAAYEAPGVAPRRMVVAGRPVPPFRALLWLRTLRDALRSAALRSSGVTPGPVSRWEGDVAPGERFSRADAKAWAHENWTGLCNVLIPSYTADLKALNEAGIRHDVRRNIELGFWGALLVSEVATTAAEMRRFMEIAVDEAAGRQYFVLHGSFDTLADTLAA